MKPCYQKKDIKTVDSLTAKYLNISSYQLMQKSGAAIFNYLRNEKSVCIVAGLGNNAGDGFVIAKLAIEHGIEVYLWSLTDLDNYQGDAKLAVQDFLNIGGVVNNKPPTPSKFDYIVDAIFGTGLSRNVEGHFADTIQWINSQTSKVIAVDIPSGLDAESGCVCGVSVKADVTVTVICYKPGLLTNNGKDYCGKLYLQDLDVPEQVFEEFPTQIYALDKSAFNHHQFKRLNNSHKGSFGNVVVVGGNDGMLGAAILSGHAALRSGCGLVEVVSNTQQNVLISLHCPELLTANSIETSKLVSSADVIAVGPGLGLNQESKDALNFCLHQNKPLVIDADAITLLAKTDICLNANAILTPHPKEAARLLGKSTKEIQNDRVQSARQISKKYDCYAVLKGSGTVVCSPTGEAFICPYGYSGMATAGMGDVLTGIIAGLIAQGFSLLDSANTAVVWHALAAEKSNKGNCLIAGDVIENLSGILND